MTPEAKASQAVRLRAAAWGIRLFRNNSGVLMNQDTGRPVRFGLANESKKLNKKFKSGDYIGITPLVITPEMVGKTIGIFTNIEAKAEGFKERENYHPNSREFAQNNFNKLIEKLGGLSGFACSEFDVDELIKKFVMRLKNNGY